MGHRDQADAQVRVGMHGQAQAEGLDIDEIITKLIATVPEPNIPKYER